jgi:predicted nucleic acid-binding protein
VLLGAVLGQVGARELPSEEIVAPPLAWSEAASVLHETVWRRERDVAAGREALDRLMSLDVSPRSPREIRSEAWRIADALGWAKTYDAEYLALAVILRCDLATLDAGLRSGAERIGIPVRSLA